MLCVPSTTNGAGSISSRISRVPVFLYHHLSHIASHRELANHRNYINKLEFSQFYLLFVAHFPLLSRRCRSIHQLSSLGIELFPPLFLINNVAVDIPGLPSQHFKTLAVPYFFSPAVSPTSTLYHKMFGFGMLVRELLRGCKAASEEPPSRPVLMAPVDNTGSTSPV